MVQVQSSTFFSSPLGRVLAVAGLLLVSLPLAACAGQMPILPEGQIQLQSGTSEVPPPSTAVESPTARAVLDLSTEVSTEGGEAALPIIRPGSPDFHASHPDEFRLASGRVQLVEFFAYWCAVCKAVAPTVHGLENMYGDQVAFVYLDRDDPRTLPIQEQLGYTYQPHFFLIDANGVVIGQWRGYIDGPELQQALIDATNE
ncbi:MAG: conjugal transfer protein TraF [Anaerolineales bacterium]|nr:MAG: conjugal transfer protein TraF [Anaerolineales bacterium]